MIEHTEPHTLARYNELLEKPSLKARAILSDLGLHGMRHTNTSVLIRRGFNAKVVSDRLGHTSVAFTLKRYAHLFDEQRRETAISMADFLDQDGEDPDDNDSQGATVTVLIPDAAD